jgi:hypothetical protein
MVCRTDIRSMSRRSIARSEWANFADEFSRRHDGWLVSVAVEEGSRFRRYAARDVPLRGVVAEPDNDTGSLMIFTSDTTPLFTHFIEHAISVEVEETAEGAESALIVTDRDGVRTILEFRSPMLPELVDGIASAERGAPGNERALDSRRSSGDVSDRSLTAIAASRPSPPAATHPATTP